MRKLFFPLAACLLLLGSCKEGEKRLTTDNGYEYILHSSTSETKAKPGDFLFFHLQIRNGDSVVYRTREESPEPAVIPFPEQDQAGQEVFPVVRVLSTMGIGDSASIFIPIDSMPETPAGFENATEMIYDMVMIDIKSADEFQAFQNERRLESEAKAAGAREKVLGLYQQYSSGALKADMLTTTSGLQYVILDQGNGPKPKAGDLVSVDYFGMLAEDGMEFDNSYSRGQPYTFPLGQGRSIAGYDEGVALLNQGGEAFLVIPSELGYGPAGSPPAIPANADLIFFVKLQEVRNAQ